jgi:2-oxoglutarate ferredoxin oxidoreductase subunit gamma
MENKIVIAGFGGQGVVIAGKILAEAGLLENKNILGSVSYGAEMRGGTANTLITISDEEIFSPIIDHPNIAILLTTPSYLKFEPLLAKGSTVIVNSGIVDVEPKRQDLNIVKVNVTKIAQELGHIRVANMAALGALVSKTNIVSKDNMVKAIKKTFGANKPEFVYINVKAFEEGMKAVEK